MNAVRGKSPYAALVATLSVGLFFLFFASVCFGRVDGIGLDKAFGIVAHSVFPDYPISWTPAEEAAVLQLRLPRIVLSVLVGASLAVAGSAYQTVFSNPIASPETIGATQASAFGAAAGMLLGFSWLGVKLGAFVFGCAVAYLVYWCASRLARNLGSIVFLVLIGMMAASVFDALVAMAKYIADPEEQLPQITYWLMGSLSHAAPEDVWLFAPFFLTGTAALWAIRWRINLLLVSDIESRSMGANVRALRCVAIVAASLLTAAATAVTGGISWIGLVIPHAARLLAGNDFRKTLPVNILLGSVFLLAIDDIARCASAAELPVSVLTSLLGAPLFFALLVRNRRMLAHEN
ncbi:MAG TPA: iron ABC transporter permease [Candidatus Coprousia avicola]|nr:iron ABC transporter permease [Candidatus Coprousia avicola]